MQINPGKIFFYLAICVYLTGFITVGSMPLVAAASFIISGLLLWASIPKDADNLEHEQKQFWIVAIPFIIPALGMCWLKYQEELSWSQFRNYITTHGCVEHGSVITGVTPGGCDRYTGECEDSREIEEQQFVCPLTNSVITFSDFKSGSFGQPR